MAASRHKLSIKLSIGSSTSSLEPFVRLQVGLDGNEVTIKNTTAATFKSGHSGTKSYFTQTVRLTLVFSTRTIVVFSVTLLHSNDLKLK